MFEVRKATFRIIPIMAFCGKSGSGKTYSALQFARGYVGEKGKICVVDTENGRSYNYAGDTEIGEFDVLEFNAPFTPERYIEAYRQACSVVGGNGFVVIDSASHEWDGIGGVCEMAEIEKQNLEARGKSASTNAWNKPKCRHKKFVNEIANPIVPTILCFKIKTTMQPVAKGQPIEITGIVTEKNFRYEMSCIFELEVENHRATLTKAPRPLHGIFQQNSIINAETGRLFAEKINSGSKKQHDSIDEIHVKISICETEEELLSVCRVYKDQKHPNLTEIIEIYRKQSEMIKRFSEIKAQEENGFEVFNAEEPEERQEQEPRTDQS